MSELKSFCRKKYTLESGVVLNQVNVSYQIFGQKLHTAPIVLVNHALTGNSNVTGSASAWWNEIVGEDKVINTKKYTIVAIDILGNGFNGNLISDYKALIARDVANLFITILESLNVKKLFSAIGGSIGGCIAWEMALLKPELIEYLIPIASDWKASDWIIGQNYVQESILNNSKEPLQDARKLAMLFYRTPASFKQKFKRSKSSKQNGFEVESWLDHHGNALEQRFELAAYQMVNHLLTTVDITRGRGVFNNAVSQLKSKVIQIGIDTDLFFVADENKKTKSCLDQVGIDNEYHEIKSIHGHDAFLIEYDQLTNILNPIFKSVS
jgi:homoserine O-acetyltransferase